MARPKGSKDNLNCEMDIMTRKEVVERIGIREEVNKIKYDVVNTVGKLNVIIERLNDLTHKAYIIQSGSK